MSHTTRIRQALLVAALAAVTGGQVVAQSAAGSFEPGGPGRLERAEELYQQALDLSANGRPRDWSRVAKLHLRSAELRPIDDPRAETSFRIAGSLLARTQPERAMTYFATAADRALVRGDVLAAAMDYVHAVIVAQEARPRTQHMVADALRYADRVVQLAHSPVLSTGERRLVLSRIGRDDQPQIASGPERP